MNKIAVLLLADTETPEAYGRLANALVLAVECVDSKDEVTLIFDGAATKWIPQIADPEHKYHRMFESVRSRAGACLYCARAFSVLHAVKAAGVAELDAYRDHPSLRQLVSDGYNVISF
jgi:hypothetical protein